MTQQRYHYPDHIRALALDMATKTGYAILQNGQVRGGVFAMPTLKKGRKTMEDDHEGKNFARFSNWIANIMDKTQPQVVFYEQPFINHANPSGSITTFAWRALLLAEASKRNIPTFGYGNSTVKKCACGHGKADKDQSVSQAKEDFPHLEIVDHNMADALHVLSYGLAARFGVETLRFGQ